MRCLVPLLLIVAAHLSGCTEPNAIDGSTVESYKSSILSLTKKLDTQERESFMEALQILHRDKMSYPSTTIDAPDLMFLSYVNGKTVEDIKRDADLHNKQPHVILQNEKRLKAERDLNKSLSDWVIRLETKP